MNLDLCQMIELHKHHERRANLTFIEEGRHVPFEVAGLYY